jgi:hypothetical protein
LKSNGCDGSAAIHGGSFFVKNVKTVKGVKIVKSGVAETK